MVDLQVGLDRVEQKLMEVVQIQVDILQQTSNHIISAGGKRFRPKVAIYSFQAVGGSELDQIVPIATALELAHSASLAHDDINDKSDTQRGKPTINALWGNTIALLTGDFLFTKLFELLAEQDQRILRAFAETGVALSGRLAGQSQASGTFVATGRAESASQTAQTRSSVAKRRFDRTFAGGVSQARLEL